jgi:hypothetical protein
VSDPTPGSHHGDAATTQAPRAAVAAARELLARTAELPASKRGLLTVLGEYRKAVFALVNDDTATTATR